MAIKKDFNDEHVELVQKCLRTMQPKPGKGQDEMAAIIAPSVKAAIKRGLTLKDIRETILKKCGIDLKISRLKKALATLEADDTLVQVAIDDTTAPEQTATPVADTAAESTAPAVKDASPVTDDSSQKTAVPSGDPGEENNASVIETTDATSPEVAGEGGDENEKPDNQSAGNEAKSDEEPAPIYCSKRVDLLTRYEDREEVSRLGARWDKPNKVWYVNPNIDLRPFEIWLPMSLEEYAKEAAE